MKFIAGLLTTFTAAAFAQSAPFTGRLVIKHYGSVESSEYVVVKKGLTERSLKNGAILGIEYKNGQSDRVVARVLSTEVIGSDGHEIDQVYLPMRLGRNKVEVLVNPDFVKGVKAVTLLGYVDANDAPVARPNSKFTCAYVLGPASDKR